MKELTTACVLSDELLSTTSTSNVKEPSVTCATALASNSWRSPLRLYVQTSSVRSTVSRNEQPPMAKPGDWWAAAAPRESHCRQRLPTGLSSCRLPDLSDRSTASPRLAYRDWTRSRYRTRFYLQKWRPTVRAADNWEAG